MPTWPSNISFMQFVQESDLIEEQVGAYSHLVLRAVQRVKPSGWVVVLDLNGLHELNHRLGWRTVDGMLRNAHLHASDPVIKIAGDEYCIPCNTETEAVQIELRLAKLYAEAGMSAFFDHAQYVGDLPQVIEVLLSRIMKRKLMRDNSFFYRLKRAVNILKGDVR